MSSRAMKQKRRKVVPPAILFLVGVSFMVFGVFRGESAIVLVKAVNLCLECIGIG